ncbi:hypothetical protein GH714_011310 [Hevea brasiliensis]|uniref:poly(A)-specific ribonuclease n=1 Tax=Hevea brasiliensis TaxID=3981 RepID=A0A6A6MV53_HEVBR|nr:hypothetical protein GH714_011310 [Hevea brasiliensis]
MHTREFEQSDKIVINGSEEELAILRDKREEERSKVKDEKPKKVKNGRWVVEKVVGRVETNGKIENVKGVTNDGTVKWFKAADLSPANSNNEALSKIFLSNYQTLKANVDLLKLIQMGLTFSDEKGNLPTCGTDKHCVWQFNFCEFNPNEDVYANDSIELLSQSGIDFIKNFEMGVDANRFSELLMSSGIVLNDSVHWVTFHSGYDFGYLLKLLTCKNLPDTQVEFFKLIKLYFPVLYDIKHLMKFCNSLHGGLNKLAELLEVERIGICHQAGSDSLLTSCTFMKLKMNFFNGSPEKYAGVLYGLGVENGQNAY